ncbi:SAM-dependent methyltransferase [Pseudoalteromonas sp. NBT06-2]|uniref:SAM-dependent methyltransferase n=1 Tax=Pseudoalteromonas sp. NBT06-2 TaxID=2025950 RepID=UPI000BA603F2|nr:SAM-dependent methyltransferase [Pseudoalteromonas sp. NBT06-2]PAJ71897.1 SAM-dependent methyltransferase [Pseudoalteromonas sp. NBT06-2]
MSSTARGKQRNNDDYYVTPQWMVDEFIEHFNADYPQDKDAFVLDPCAGGCDKYEMSYPTVLQQHGFKHVETLDIRNDSRANFILDYLEPQLAPIYKLIITNPPFNCSAEIAEKAFKDVSTNGHIVMLQRLNWLGSKKRKSFWENAPLKHVYVHHKRAGFDPEKPSAKDSVEYAHFVFQRGYVGLSHISII